MTYSWRGDAMSDGLATPGAHDGMAASRTGDDTLTLVRSHEQGSCSGRFAEPACGRHAGRRFRRRHRLADVRRQRIG
jgi:uncharacterized protein